MPKPKPTATSLTNLIDHVIARHLGKQDRALTDKILHAIATELRIEADNQEIRKAPSLNNNFPSRSS